MDADYPRRWVIIARRFTLCGLHDFLVGTGAIEVKTTVASSGFPATVRSLEQLDGTRTRPLFLAGVRLSLDNLGKTLPEFVSELTNLLGVMPQVMEKFEALLLRAGFLKIFSDCYNRRFINKEIRILPINSEFPALIRGNVNAAIQKVQYELDLDSVGVSDVGMEAALKELGVFK